MVVNDYAKQVPFDEEDGDDGPTVFRRNNTSSKQQQLISAAKKSSSQSRNGTSVRISSDHNIRNGETLNSQKRKIVSTNIASTKVSAVVNSSSQAPVTHHSDKNNSSNNVERTDSSKVVAEDSESGDPDDEKPLSFRRKMTSMEGQKVSKELSEHKLNNDNAAKSVVDKLCVGPSSVEDSDDDKPLSLKFSSASVMVQKNGSLHAKVALESPKPQIEKVKENIKNQYDDSEDEKPLISRSQPKSVVAASARKFSDADEKHFHTKKLKTSMPPSSSLQQTASNIKNNPDDSDDEKPLLSRLQSPMVAGTSINKSFKPGEKKPLTSSLKQNGSSNKDSNSELKTAKILNKRPLADGNNSTDASTKKARFSEVSISAKVKHEDAHDNDNISIGKRMKKQVSSDNKSPSNKVIAKNKVSSLKKDSKSKKAMKSSMHSKSLKLPPGSGGGQKWTTLEHNGVIFPPPYKPHGVKLLYNGQPVDLTPEQEEVATMFAVMKDTDYATKPKFIENFMNDWKQILGRNHVIKKFELCDFTPIYEWHLKEKEKKKQMTTEEKKALKEDKLKQEDKYMWAIVDGVKEKVGNFRVEPPALFRGRGEHPKMGKLKKRIRPSDITINIGKGAPVPECSVPGEMWKDVKHDNTVTWLAFWNDPINPKEFKYVFLAASSSLKGQSDKEKYEKARMLKDYIQNIRANYTKDFTSKDATKRQIAVATYLIDKLALRAGNEKDDDEADTVGCCTLKVENVMLIPPNKLQFDFLGKDSIRYFNTVEVAPLVYKAIGDFRSAKKSNGDKKANGDDLFDLLDTNKLNAHLKELMPGLTAKVFRTYNASITLDDMLNSGMKYGTVLEKIAVYQQANKEVAIICNHQRSVSKSHDTQMSRLNEKINDLKAQREELNVDLTRAKKGKPPLNGSDGKSKRNMSSEVLEKKLAQIDAKIEKMELDKKIKEDLKTVALGTSKINYLDPRISVAWCKRHEVPIEKIFNKSLLAKFAWAMDVEPSYRF